MGSERSGHALRALGTAGAIVALAGVALWAFTAKERPAVRFEPLAAVLTKPYLANAEALVPSMCYTKTAGVSNPCWTCHTASIAPNDRDDWDLQESYAFSPVAKTNHWRNLFEDRRAEAGRISDGEVLEWIREDNYTGLRESLERYTLYRGYLPDLDLRRGFDPEGFARDGSGWRAVRYKPFLGTFWPTNGSTDDVMIRLPGRFQQDAHGRFDRETYKLNLAILEAAICSPPPAQGEEPVRRVEPVDEALFGEDLDGDGEVGGRITTIRGVPERFAGAARFVPVYRHLYPQGTEFLHTVRYIDPDAPGLLSRRLKEVRYLKKDHLVRPDLLARLYAREKQEKDLGYLPDVSGSPVSGFHNGLGWRVQGFIEDARGALRLQTREEHAFCLGCHANLGVTVDVTFGFPRKVPGEKGWGHQRLDGIQDVPQAGHAEPETLTYFTRVRGGDEFRSNDEVLARFFPGGILDEAEVRRAAPGGDRDLRHLVLPSRRRALELNKAYLALVRRQRFDLGRVAFLGPVQNVHPRIDREETDLKAAGLVFKDGRLWLDWTEHAP